MRWWPILEDAVGIAGDRSLHAVDMGDDRNKDFKPPAVARCGIIVWKVYGVGVQDGGTMVMPWPPKVRVARDAYEGATVCAECRTLGTPKRVCSSWNKVVSASSRSAARPSVDGTEGDA